MIICPSCGHENPDNARECERCGASLASVAYVECPSCHALNPPDRQYCHHCFANLRSQAEEEPESLISPYEPPSASPEEFRGRLHGAPPNRPSGAGVDLDATVADMLQRESDQGGASNARRAPVEPAEAAELPPRAEDVTPELPTKDAGDAEAAAPLPANEAPAPPEHQAEAQATVAAEPKQAPPGAESAETQERAEPTWLTPSSSPLEDVQNPIPMEAIVALPHRSIPPVERPLTQEERADASLFQQIAEEPAPLHAPTVYLWAQRPGILSGTGRTILYALVLLAALCPLVTGGRTAAWVQPRATVAQLASDLSLLPNGAVVLVSFDYSPAYAGELDPLAEAVLQHLAAQSVPIVALATRPEGIGLAEGVLDRVSARVPEFTYGDDFALLGYLPGQEAGLRTLTHSLHQAFAVDQLRRQPLDQLPATRGLATVQDAAYVLVIADDDVAVRRWIEQVGSRSAVTLQALVTARVEPMLIPYEQAGQLRTVVAGVYGAAQYQVATGLNGGGGAAGDALAALLILLLLVAIVTNVIYAIRGENATTSTS